MNNPDQINKLLSDSQDIFAHEPTAGELDELVRSFFTENPIDNLGTSSAIITYALAMNIIINKQGTDLANDAVFNLVTSIGLSASFMCGLSFTSSSYEQIQEYRREHLRTKNAIYNNIFLSLVLQKTSDENRKKLSTIAKSEVRVITNMLDANRLELVTKGPRKYPPHEIERIKNETDLLEIQLYYAEEKLKIITSFEAETDGTLNIKIDEHKRRIIDILKRPLYEADVDYSSNTMTEDDERYERMASTSLYAKKTAIEKQLKHIEKQKQGTTDPAAELRLLEDKHIVQQQIDYYIGILDALDKLKNPINETEKSRIDTSTNNTQNNNTQDKTNEREKEEKIITFLRPLDTRTKSLWRNEKRELMEFGETIQNGMSEGIAQLIQVDKQAFKKRDKSKWYEPLSQFDFYLRKKLKANKTPVWRQFCIGLYIIWSIPYFFYYAISNISNLLDNLKKVVDALHKSSRDIDLALRYHSGDPFLARLFIRYPLQLLWASITFIPETLGGLAYYMLSFFRKDSNVIDVSRAINPPGLADWIQDHSTANDSLLKKSALYFLVFLGGIVNTFWSPIKKVFSILSIDENDDTIRASRDTLSAAWEIFTSRVKIAWRNVFSEPIISAWTQIAEQRERLNAQYPFRRNPFLWIWNQFTIPFLFAGNIFLNVILRSVYLGLKNLARTAPLITAAVITVSTLMTGVTVPFLFTLAFGPSIQLWFAAAAMTGDATNGMHDAYNLSNAILQQKHKKAAEDNAIKKLNGKNDIAEFNRWKTIYERIEEGKHIEDKIKNSKPKYDEYGYKIKHIEEMKVLLKTLSKTITKESVEELLARHIAYFLVNTSKDKRAKEYNFLVQEFQKNKHITSMANKLLNSMPDGIKVEDQLPFLLSSTTLLGYDFAKETNALRYQHYRDEKIYLRTNANTSISMKRSLEDRNIYISKCGQYTATKLSWWERFKRLFTPAEPSTKIVDGYEIKHTSTDKRDEILSIQPRQTTDLYLVKNDGSKPIKGYLKDDGLFYFENPNSEGKPYTAKQLSWFENHDNQNVIMDDYLITNMNKNKAKNYHLAWLNPVNTINVNKGLASLATQVEKGTKSLCVFRGFSTKQSLNSAVGSPRP